MPLRLYPFKIKNIYDGDNVLSGTIFLNGISIKNMTWHTEYCNNVIMQKLGQNTIYSIEL